MGGVPAPVGDWHVGLKWREELGLAQARHCRIPPLRYRWILPGGFGHMLWDGGTGGSLYCSQNHTNITPGFAVLDRNLPRLLLASKCIACEIKVKTSLSWYLKSVISHILLGKSCTLRGVALADPMQHDNAIFLYSKRNPEKIFAKLQNALRAHRPA